MLCDRSISPPSCYASPSLSSFEKVLTAWFSLSVWSLVCFFAIRRRSRCQARLHEV